MKKALSLILALVMAMTAMTGIALAETAEKTNEKSDKSNLAGLLEGLFSEGEGEGEEADLSGLLGQFGGLFGQDGEEADLSGLLGGLGGLFGQEGEEADLSGLLGGLGGLFGQEGEEVDLSGLMGMFGGLLGQEGEEVDLSDLMGMFGGLFVEAEGAQGEENLFGKITKSTHEDFILADSIEQFYGNWVLSKVILFGEEVPASEISESGATLLTINEKGIFFDEENSEETPPQLKDGFLTLGDNFPVSVYLTADGICVTLPGVLDMYFAAAK